MPIVLPTPQEFAGLHWQQRRAVVQRAALLLRAYRVADPKATGKPARPWHEEVIEQAREIHSSLGDDPDAARHFAELAVVVSS